MKPPAVLVEERPDGVLILRHPDPLPEPCRTIIDFIRRWALERPAQPAIAVRSGHGWQQLTYRQLTDRSESVAQALLDRGVMPQDRIMILSGASIEHAILQLGAMTIGASVAPISPHYARKDPGLGRLRAIYELLKPTIVFFQELEPFRAAVEALLPYGGLFVTADPTKKAHVLPFDVLIETAATRRVDHAYQKVDPDSIAKILFTSGSTAEPKGVINTHRMLCVNQAMLDAIERDGGERETPPTAISWQPWHHTMAGNATFNRSLRQGGVYYIDDGGPSQFARTLENLATVSPTTYSDVPLSWSMLVESMEGDANLRRKFFQHLESVTFAGASLPNSVWVRLQKLAIQETRQRIPVVAGLGSTETAPALFVLAWPTEATGYVGLPLPGTEAKLVPLSDGRYELRARGPNITPGYFRSPELTANAFDEEGFFCLGDALRIEDRHSPTLGLRFAGRIAEDFKLTTGTWVCVGPLRSQLLEEIQLAREIVIAGADRESIGLLIWPDVGRCRLHLGDQADALDDQEVALHPDVRCHIIKALIEHNRRFPASSTRVDRFCVADRPLSAAAGEINEKGYVNQAATLIRRSSDVEDLYAPEPSSPNVLLGDWMGEFPSSAGHSTNAAAT